ncbi:MAG: succinyl-diaminopimelate desuccinylase [Acidimicrobiales bacterium]|nr:succinyl-diaminopimelate desuccinylase [Acidimicrobiales bacterium]
MLELTAELVDIPSPSHHEGAIADHLEARLRRAPWLTLERVGDNLVARTRLGRPLRLVLAGHTDTVPANGNERARVDGEVLWGLGSSDMKSGLAVMLELATTLADPAIDVTYVFYVAEEVEARFNGLGILAAERPDLLAGDAALLGEPTGGALEAGCQGSLRLALTLTGARAHSARPWTGRNAVHRLAPVLGRLQAYEERRPVIHGCEFREALQAVGVEGGVAGNVVPDRVRLTLNHRFAPDRSAADAEAHVREALRLAEVLEDGDSLEVVDVAAGAPPSLDHPLLAELVRRNRLVVRAKLGWTDVARFAALGVPAANLGPGDPTLAHTAGERVERAAIERVHGALAELLTSGA